jgi:EAL and modified HD-GYP domain-containing signal transduction protein
MRDLVRNLFAKRATARATASTADDVPAFVRLNQVAPLGSVPLEPGGQGPDSKLSFVCREVILDRTEHIAGYEFALHRKLHYRFAADRTAVRRIYDDLLLRSIGSMNIHLLLGHRFALVDIAPESFSSPQIATLSPAQTVLMLHPGSSTGLDFAVLETLVKEARSAGFRVGWYRTAAGPSPQPLLHLLDFLQVRCGDFDGLQLTEIVRGARTGRRPDSPPFHLLASDVTSLDEFRLCFQAGYDFFQGSFVNNREQWHPPKSEIDRMRVIRILNIFQSGAETAELSELIRQDPVLTYKMLRYINSPALGLGTEITQIEQGLTLLGRGPFYRWLSLLLFDVKGAGFTERVLFETALVRARLMEQIAPCSERPGLVPDHLFMVGLFSLLDQMLQIPLAAILEKITLPDPVRQALLERSGPLAPFLGLSLICETGDPDEMELLSAACRVDVAIVNRELSAAHSWAEKVAMLG